MSDGPSPFELWQQAADEHAWAQTLEGFRVTSEAIRRRYRELMIEHGHLVQAKPDDDPNLPCGWPGHPTSEESAQ